MTTYLIGPDGKRWALVPKKATAEMLEAALNRWDLPTAATSAETYPNERSCYQSSIAAAPDFPRDALVEKMADAIAVSYGQSPDDYAPISVMCDDNNQPVLWREVYTEQARAVLGAIMGEVSDEDLAR